MLELGSGMSTSFSCILQAALESKKAPDVCRGEMQKELHKIMNNKEIMPVFQPIVSLTDAEIIGYEALSRGPENSILHRPDMLFAAAESCNQVWELEYLCRITALEQAKRMKANKMLFINVDPKIINDVRFEKGVTRDVLKKYQIDPTNIIFEITEKTSVEDYRSFRRILDNYTSQGYKIAIDDTGSGYSGLRMLAETRPQYIKIDMQLVRGIDTDTIKQALIRAFYDFAVAANMKVIAEGIETKGELFTLIDIGIDYGQGYLLQRPAVDFMELKPEVHAWIRSKNEQKKKEKFYTAVTMPVGEITRQDGSFSSTTLGAEIIEIFNANPALMGVPIVDNEKPVGLLMKDKLLGQLATQYGMAVYMNRPIDLLVDKQPLIVDYNTPIEQVSKLAISRPDATLYDYILVTSANRYYGVTTVRHLLEKTTQLEINRAKHSNPLSGLPGNILVEEKLKQTIESKQPFAVLYFDLDNFKPYNDVYGFENGDKILCMTAKLVQRQIDELVAGEAFLGHIGGDDFIAVLDGHDVEFICQSIISVFDARIREFYNENDRRDGFIIAKNRHDIEEKFPLISLSIAVVTNKDQEFLNVAQLAEAAGGVKKQCKLVWHSCYKISSSLDKVNMKLTSA